MIWLLVLFDLALFAVAAVLAGVTWWFVVGVLAFSFGVVALAFGRERP